MISSATSRFPVWLKSSSISRRTTALELPPIGWQLFILGNSKSDSTAFPLFLDTYATRLLAEPLNLFCGHILYPPLSTAFPSGLAISSRMTADKEVVNALAGAQQQALI